MKKTILFSAFIVAALSVSAQIPNSGFETWTTVGSYSEPDSWGTLNAMTTSMSVYTAEKGTPGSPGTSYLKLTSKTVTGMGVMPGITATGQINMSTMNVTGGFAYTTRPANLTGSWQYMAMSGTDQGFIAVYLTKWNSSTMMRDTVASTIKPLAGMEMSWATFSIPLTYNKSFAPDSALIIMSSSGVTPANGSYLWVDNLAFSGAGPTAIASTESTIGNVTVYPNPTKDKINISYSIKEDGNYTVQIVDLLGKVVSTQTVHAIQGNNRLTIDIPTLAAGTYSLNLSNGTQSAAQKFVIQ
ncbi:MAG: T9SS type A sorting domain-containing protein [Taibaiella sp.]|jgi:hypothetical protein